MARTYFSCQLGDGLCHLSHLLGEPETTIDVMEDLRFEATKMWPFVALWIRNFPVALDTSPKALTA